MKFKCKQSGCIVEFIYEHDILDMLSHPQYEKVEEVEKKEEVSPKVTKTKD